MDDGSQNGGLGTAVYSDYSFMKYFCNLTGLNNVKIKRGKKTLLSPNDKYRSNDSKRM